MTTAEKIHRYRLLYTEYLKIWNESGDSARQLQKRKDSLKVVCAFKRNVMANNEELRKAAYEIENGVTK